MQSAVPTGVIIVILCVICVCLAAIVFLVRPWLRRLISDETVQRVRVGDWELNVSHHSSVGKRAQQQDAYALRACPDCLFCIVCDGMGGMAMGAEASTLAVRTILETLERNGGVAIEEAMLSALNEASEKVYQMCQGHGGTTAVLAGIDQRGLSYFSAGDSRIYLFRNRRLKQLGQDHIFYYDLMRSRRATGMTAQEAASHPEHDHLTSYLGREILDRVNSTDAPIPLADGDRVLIMTDGIYRSLTEKEMTRAIANGESAGSIADRVLKKGYSRQDNLTIIRIDVKKREGGKA